MCVCVHVRLCEAVCVCVCVWSSQTTTFLAVIIHIVCVSDKSCVCFSNETESANRVSGKDDCFNKRVARTCQDRANISES